MDPPSDDAEKTVHSALTTLLIDDSPLKAHLQPWNHVCVPEYIYQLRQKDVRVATHERLHPPLQPSTEATESTVDEAPPVHTSKKGKKAKKAQKSKALTEQPSESLLAALTDLANGTKKRGTDKLPKPVDTNGEQQEDWDSGSLRFDETLIAIVGILDTLKLESNVAGWIRAGGLWAGHRKHIDADADSGNEEDSNMSLESASEGEDSSLSVDGGRKSGIRKRQRLSSDGDVASSHNAAAAPPALGSSDPVARALSPSPQVDVPSPAPTPPPSSQTIPPPSPSQLPAPNVEEALAELKEPEVTHWFEHEAVVAHWVSRGREALRELDIAIVHGVTGETSG